MRKVKGLALPSGSPASFGVLPGAITSTTPEMSLRGRDIERGDAAPRDAARRHHGIEHALGVMVGRIAGAARDLEFAVAPRQRLADRRPVAKSGWCQTWAAAPRLEAKGEAGRAGRRSGVPVQPPAGQGPHGDPAGEFDLEGVVAGRLRVGQARSRRRGETPPLRACRAGKRRFGLPRPPGLQGDAAEGEPGLDDGGSSSILSAAAAETTAKA